MKISPIVTESKYEPQTLARLFHDAGARYVAINQSFLPSWHNHSRAGSSILVARRPG
jgi:hypothetical protein